MAPNMTYGWTNSIQAKKCIPIGDNRVYPARKYNFGQTFISLIGLFFLDLRSEGLSSLASLGRQLSFFPTISEKKVQSRKEKFVLNCIPCLVTLCHQAGIYIPLS